ncbi:hypothetical protein M409DRAFT_49293 [Zasmidium cellare ATCC 36951]|uniref:Uncharacterized protein n=1 Tax=Zasmidium cellare ATCC 36951 TaxID=1080233 RepID=A0A6A6D3P8_ZASCE|nr:uncharacterized protein M409DRAFT_49293 [Zasmidium cellare ATCC 36951]KAF2172759.1 hypothetical protein M409DRAFT_49293 [Zasmidium cellare ATCC 36951]
MRLLVTPAIALALLGNLAVGQICPRSLSIRSVEDSTASFLDLLNLSDRPNPLSRSIEPRQGLGWDPRVSMPRGPVCNSGDGYTVAQCEIDILKARGCNVLACVSAAAACLASCATAAGQGALGTYTLGAAFHKWHKEKLNEINASRSHR